MLAATDSSQQPRPVDLAFSDYDTVGFYDEMFLENGQPRPRAGLLASRLKGLTDGELTRRQRVADQALLNMGITFNVYGHEAGTEKIWPFDLIPRIIESAEWQFIDSGLKQRIKALNLFIDDVYHDQNIVKEGIFPEYMISSSKNFLKQCVGLNPPGGIWCHITGTDLVRDADGTVYVLEDNLRCPSGVSYVLENREVMKRTFPQVFEQSHIRPVEAYPSQLLDALHYLAPDAISHRKSSSPAPARSAAAGLRTARITCAPATASARLAAICAPAASKSASGMPEAEPAPACTTT
jgi:uncharacterized circularly permuted ATP-grasp superfamily protein